MKTFSKIYTPIIITYTSLIPALGRQCRQSSVIVFSVSQDYVVRNPI